MGKKSKTSSCNKSDGSIFVEHKQINDHTMADIFIKNNYLAITTTKYDHEHITHNQTISLAAAPDKTITAQDTSTQRYAEVSAEIPKEKTKEKRKNKEHLKEKKSTKPQKHNAINNLEIADQIKKIGQKIRCDGHIDDHELSELKVFINNTQSKLPMKKNVAPLEPK